MAIVDDYAGVTRDRMTTLIESNDRFFELIDTGGMGIVDEDNLTEDVRRQIELAINSADVILSGRRCPDRNDAAWMKRSPRRLRGRRTSSDSGGQQSRPDSTRICWPRNFIASVAVI